MQLVTFLSAASAMVATASASKGRSAVTLNAGCNLNEPHARIINRCKYPVHLWSVFKGDGCPDTEMVTLKTGEVYSENFPKPDPEHPTNVGISIKVSKTEQCKGNDITQLEYYLERQNKAYAFNYLDVSYVDCLGGDCPTKKEGYYLKAGNQQGAYAASAGNTWCPILACHDEASCAKMSYILPDDVQTKTCDLDQNMDFYMCGGDAPGQDYPAAPVKPSPSSVKDTYGDSKFKADAAVVTAAPEVKEPAKHPKTKTHVEVVYVTAYEYVNAKRHAHGHARRHQQFRA